MDSVATALGDPAVRGWYVAFCFAVMILPMIAMAYWYHTRIRRTEGGRRLMARQNDVGAGPYRSLGSAFSGLQEGASMMKDIAAGRYGREARAMQNRVYWIVGMWVAANVVFFGVLIWADEVNRAAN